MVTATTIGAAVVELLAETPRRVRRAGEPVEHAAHGLRGVVLHVAHVRGDHGEAELRDHAVELRRAAGVGRHLGAQVGEVLLEVADRMGGAREQFRRLGLAQPAVLDQPEVLDEDALLVDRAAAGRHGAGGDAADVGVVGARGDEEERRGRSAGGGPPGPGPLGNTGVITVRSGRWVPPA